MRHPEISVWSQVAVWFASLLLIPLWAGLVDAADLKAGPIALLPYNFLDQRRSHATHLLVHGPAPQAYEVEQPPPGVERVTYESAGRQLWGWLAMPEGAGAAVPGIVYAHGGFAFGASDFNDARAFLDAGFAVFTPTLRGENGNPGNFEFFYGEVDDLAAAVRSLAAQLGVRGDRVYAFGHSVGGALAALLALFPDVPLRASGSASGIWLPESFPSWRKSRIRFPLSDPLESELRTMLPHMDELERPHLAYMGDQEWPTSYASAVTDQAIQVGAPLRVVTVRGDHFTALRPAIAHFIEFIRQDID